MFDFLRRICGRRKDSPALPAQLLERLDVTNHLLARICVLLEETREVNTRSERYANTRLLIVLLFSILLGAPGAVVAMSHPVFKPARYAVFSTPVEIFNNIFGLFPG